MLKFPIFKLMNELIGEYLIGFSKEQLTLQLTEKSMSFTNLILNPKKVNEKLDSNSIFCHLKSGMIKDLKIEVLSIVESKDIKITIKELFLIFGPNLSYMKANEDSNDKKDLKKELDNLKKLSKEKKASKFSLLKSLFLEKVLLKNQKNKPKVKKETASYSDKDKLIYEVLKNIKIYIEEFHLRYEDDQISNPISFGFLVHEISIINSEQNLLQEFNKKSQFVYLNLETKVAVSSQKTGKSKNTIMKTITLNQIIGYFNTKSELYIPASLYENTKDTRKGIFEAINYFDLEYYMKMYFHEKERKFLFKLFEIQGKLQIDLTIYSEDLVINPEENYYLANITSEAFTLIIKREVLQEITNLLDFIKNFDILEVLSYFKPSLKPIINSDDKVLNHTIIKEWFELGVWYNRLIAYRDSKKFELIENSLILSTHLNNLNKRPQIMKALNKLIDSPLHLALHMNFLYLKIEILDDFQRKIVETQIQEPIMDLAINQTPNTMSFFIKSECFQTIAHQPDDFEPERYEIPFEIPVFDKSTKKKIFEQNNSMKNKENTPLVSVIIFKDGLSLTFVSSGIDIDGKTIDLKANLKSIEANIKQSGIVKLCTVFKDFLTIPYFSRKKPTDFLRKRIITLLEAWKPHNPKAKNPVKEKNNELEGFDKVILTDIKNEKNRIETSQFFFEETYKKYDLKDLNSAIKEKNSKILYQELMILKAKAQKKQIKEKALELKEDLKRMGVFIIIDYGEIDLKLEKNIKKSQNICNFKAPEGKIQVALNQAQNEMNFLMINGLKLEVSKDLDYLFEIVLKLL